MLLLLLLPLSKGLVLTPCRRGLPCGLPSDSARALLSSLESRFLSSSRKAQLFPLPNRTAGDGSEQAAAADGGLSRQRVCSLPLAGSSMPAELYIHTHEKR